MYAVFYRLGGDEETWRQAPMRYVPGEHITAMHTADVIQATLRHAGHQSAQAEVRELPYVPPAEVREVEAPEIEYDVPVDLPPLATRTIHRKPVSEGEHSETPPDGYSEFDPTTNAAQWAQYANWSTPSRWPLPGGSVNVTPRLLKCKSCGQVNSHSATCKEPW